MSYCKNEISIVLLTHFWNYDINCFYNKLFEASNKIKADLHVLADESKISLPIKAYYYDFDKLRSQYNFFREDSWRGSTDIPVIDWAIKNDYSYHWVLEYDVRYSGNYSSLLTRKDALSSDLSCNMIHTFRERPDWMWWGSLLVPFNIMPMKSLMPFYGISKKGVLAVCEARKSSKWFGHYETIVPTSIQAANLKLNPLWISTYSQFRATPTIEVGAERDKLWHPVKKYSKILL